MLAGVHRPDTGTLRVNGADVDFAGPADAKAAGIALIYQEPTLFPDLSVAENIAMGNQPLTRLRQIDRKAMHATADRLFARLGVHIDPTRPARGLSIADLCERVTIMRDGKHVATEMVADLTVDDMIRRMVGRDLSALFPKQDVEPGEVLLEISDLSREGVFRDVSFTVRAGEIVALAGLVGSGRSEVVQAVFGVDPYDSGTVKIRGKRLKPGSPRAAMAAGMALVPE